MASPQFLPPKGFRDQLPETMAIRQYIQSVLVSVFERYGFQPLATPTVEYASTLMGKYGAEADKLLYLFKDRGGRDLGLNYDLTVPTARVLAAYPDLAKPFKRYQIQSAFRAENPQRGRYRQFTQCDIDIIGTNSPLADAEVLAVINDSLEALELPGFSININSRPVLYRLAEALELPEKSWNSLLQTIDKADKLEGKDLDNELEGKGFDAKLYTSQIKGMLEELETNFADSGLTGDPNLDQIYQYALGMGIPGPNLRFAPNIVRGLDYYTGSIFETVVTEPKIGSVTGGGRYDKLIGQLGGPDLPAVGTTLGLDRLTDVAVELKLWPNVRSVPSVLVTVFSPTLLPHSLKFAQGLREDGIRTELYLNPSDRLDKQLKYANKRQIPYCVILGEAEVEKDAAVLKDMATGDQEILPFEDVRARLAKYEKR